MQVIDIRLPDVPRMGRVIVRIHDDGSIEVDVARTATSGMIPVASLGGSFDYRVEEDA